MNKRNYLIVLMICLALLISSCNKSGASTGGAPKTPYLGGTNAITVNFEKDSPPPEVTDDESFAFKSIVRLKNDGEFKVEKNNIKVNLVGFDPADFGKDFSDLKDVVPQDDLEPKRRDAEGNTIEGTTTFATFPRSGDDFVPTKFLGNTPFTFRADVCYYYETHSQTNLCVLRDLINIRQNENCRPDTAKTIYSSSAPVQVNNFRESVIGKDKLSFSFDIVLNGKVDIFADKSETKPTNFDAACPRDPRARREVENNVIVEITEIPKDPIFTDLRCGGLDNSNKGVVRLVNGKRTITCTVSLVQDRSDYLEKRVGINLAYNVLDRKETQVLIKHLADGS